MEEQEIKPPVEKVEKLIPHKLEPAQEIYFLERHDGSILSVTEREAWELLKFRQPVLGRYTPPMKLIGVSDGRTYQAAIIQAQEMAKQGKPMEEVQAMMRKGWSDELAAARGNIKRPRNFDIVDNRGRPTNPNFGGLQL